MLQLLSGVLAPTLTEPVMTVVMLQLNSVVGSASQDGVVAFWDVSDLHTQSAQPKPQPTNHVTNPNPVVLT